MWDKRKNRQKKGETKGKFNQGSKLSYLIKMNAVICCHVICVRYFEFLHEFKDRINFYQF